MKKAITKIAFMLLVLCLVCGCAVSNPINKTSGSDPT